MHYNPFLPFVAFGALAMIMIAANAIHKDKIRGSDPSHSYQLLVFAIVAILMTLFFCHDWIWFDVAA